MLSQKDIALLRGMFQEQDSRFDQKLCDLRLDVRDDIHSCIVASEKRMMRNLEERLNEVKVEIIDGITDILDEFVFPPITELETDMTRVKGRLQMA